MNAKTTDILLARAQTLRLNGLVGHWSEVSGAEWVAPLIQWEEDERTHRSLQRRIRAAKLGDFKSLDDFDWQWPKRIDRVAVNELMSLEFVREATNAVFIGPNGVGKSTLAQNVA
ncbi:ATP-binding protein, partial [Paraburkholderia sp.]|uniref:ATP-binding protein n=1 Tax=Paraburkholderia sp. TaxID=1926495 RepID=UPI002F3F1D27